MKEYRKTYDKPRVTLTLSKGEYTDFSKVADKEDLPVSAVVKNMALAYLQSIPYTPTGVEEKLNDHNFLVRNIANNINQIAHRVNMDEVVSIHEVLGHLKHLDSLVREFIKK